MKKTILLLLLFFCAFPSGLPATEQYARETGKGCRFCHQQSTGGQLNTVGFAFIRNGYDYPISPAVLKKAESLQSPFHKILRFVIGYLHLLAAIVFFGAIFYIHLFVKPSRLIGGIPKPERLLGLSCMAVITVTGIYLTWVRIWRWEQFFNNTFGLMLFIKILLFISMVLIGLTAVTVIHRKMKAETRSVPQTEEVTADTISRFDGSGDNPAYFIYENQIYDVTGNARWKNGRHFGKHSAGTDLTDALAGAPHGTEVFERVASIGQTASGGPEPVKPLKAHNVFIVMAYTNLILIFLILACISVWRWGLPFSIVPESRSQMVSGQTCVDCHRINTPGIHTDWQNSTHGMVGVTCEKCHATTASDLVLTSHLSNTPIPIAVVVSPKTCGGCHPKQVEEYDRSKHAHTLEIMWDIDHWLNDGMNNAIERTTGCYACHGTEVELVDGKPVGGTWPNVGVGRRNPDGSLGSCSSCHTRHRFSLVEARKPEACDQCHLGPDHPQIEIYNESKHGTLYHAEGDEWIWHPEKRDWQAGVHFRAPTCAACHMSGTGLNAATHDTTERLAWETQAPRTVRPSDFEPFPADTDWPTQRRKMESVCLQCHSLTWTKDHFQNYDEVIANYNVLYYDPVKERMDQLYAKGLLSKEPYFDEEIEWQFYELWHHEGRRARMGAAMMAPDYAWWHGFYELKHRYACFMDLADELLETGESEKFDRIPGRFGQGTRPD
ncbi:MAG: multiheme c-type cytochrome [Desulfobacterales bacterium]